MGPRSPGGLQFDVLSPRCPTPRLTHRHHGVRNSPDFRRLPVIQLTLDSLRYWVENIGVDGFRFDLAVTLGREGDSFNHMHPLYVAMATDLVLSQVKLINEPWDLGLGGWRTGQFPPPQLTGTTASRHPAFVLGDRTRVIIHGGQGGDQRDLATRIAGSADLFGHGRIPGGRGFSLLNQLHHRPRRLHHVHAPGGQQLQAQ